jgi:hypothetical protein
MEMEVEVEVEVEAAATHPMQLRKSHMKPTDNINIPVAPPAMPRRKLTSSVVDITGRFT